MECALHSWLSDKSGNSTPTLFSIHIKQDSNDIHGADSFAGTGWYLTGHFINSWSGHRLSKLPNESGTLLNTPRALNLGHAPAISIGLKPAFELE